MIQTAIAGGAAALATCIPACDAPAPSTQPARPAQVIFVGEDYNLPFDARPGDTIILVMTPDGNQLSRCNDAGGELIYNPFTLIWTCEGVDF